MSLLVLIACIIKADGTVKASELATVRRILNANFGRQETDDAMNILDRLLSQNIDETEVARQIDRNMNYSSKLELLHILFQIAYADGEVNPQELALLQRIAGDPIFGVTLEELDQVLEPRKYVGRAPEQTADFLTQTMAPVLARYTGIEEEAVEINV